MFPVDENKPVLLPDLTNVAEVLDYAIEHGDFITIMMLTLLAKRVKKDMGVK